MVSGSSPIVAYMMVTGDLYGRKINRGARKLARTPTLNYKKNIYVMVCKNWFRNIVKACLHCTVRRIWQP